MYSKYEERGPRLKDICASKIPDIGIGSEEAIKNFCSRALKGCIHDHYPIQEILYRR
jgi:hypothetical protein